MCILKNSFTPAFFGSSGQFGSKFAHFILFGKASHPGCNPFWPKLYCHPAVLYFLQQWNVQQECKGA